MFLHTNSQQSQSALWSCRDALVASLFSDETAGEVSDGAGEADASLEDVARSEREYVRERLRAELGREPTDEEVDEWLSRHTEGY